VNPGIEWATWIVVRRSAIDCALAARRGGEAPHAAAPET